MAVLGLCPVRGSITVLIAITLIYGVRSKLTTEASPHDDDETLPGCSGDQFECVSFFGSCISKDRVCDGAVDCQDERDEVSIHTHSLY